MKRVLILGSNHAAIPLAEAMQQCQSYHIIAIAEKHPSALFKYQVSQLKTELITAWDNQLLQRVDVIIEAGAEAKVCFSGADVLPEIMSSEAADMMLQVVKENKQVSADTYNTKAAYSAILEQLHEGVLTINKHCEIAYLNENAANMLKVNKTSVLGAPIQTILPESGLPETLKTREAAINQQYTLDSGEKLVITQMPLFSQNGGLEGAMAVFRPSETVVQLAEQVTELKEIKSMLEAIIHSSEEAISVVDENGIGLIVNPAYTKLTGYQAEEIVGKPAVTDIAEGDSLHLQVLKTRRPARGARLRVGSNKKEVIVNAAPIMADGVLRGSVAVLHNVSALQELQEEVSRARSVIRSLEHTYTLKDIAGNAPAVKLAMEQARYAAFSSAPCLIRGEAGTGKTMFASAIHYESDHKYYPLIRISCAVLNQDQLKRKLFDGEQESGMLHPSEKQTIVLEHVEYLRIDLQEQLLQYLIHQETEGLNRVRLIATSRAALEKAVYEGLFLESLFQKLNRVSIFVPALKERTADLPELLSTIIHKINIQQGSGIESISNASIRELKEMNWPGNVKQLEIFLQEAMRAMKPNEYVIEPKHLPTDPKENAPGGLSQAARISLQEQMEAVERELIETALQQHGFQKKATADALGVSVRNLYYKMEKYELHNSVQDYS